MEGIAALTLCGHGLDTFERLKSFLIRCALVSEQKALEDLQTRASL
jgi:hypothetical protein